MLKMLIWLYMSQNTSTFVVGKEQDTDSITVCGDMEIKKRATHHEQHAFR